MAAAAAHVCDKGNVVNRKGFQLFCREWYIPLPAKSPMEQTESSEEEDLAEAELGALPPVAEKTCPRALVFVSHGFSEHLGMYETLGGMLAEAGMMAFGHDHVGHGLSQGERAYIENVDDYVDDLVDQCVAMKERFPSIPLFLVAHSMGGMIALKAVIDHPKLFRGMVLQGPLIVPGRSLFGSYDLRITTARALLARFGLAVLRFFSPHVVLGKVNVDLITRDETAKRSLEADVHRWTQGCRVGLLQAFVSCLEDNLNLLSSVSTPFLALHGDKDGLCNVTGSRLLHSVSPSEDKTLKEYPGALHNLYLEVPEVSKDALESTIDWIAKRCDVEALEDGVEDGAGEGLAGRDPEVGARASRTHTHSPHKDARVLINPHYSRTVVVARSLGQVRRVRRRHKRHRQTLQSLVEVDKDEEGVTDQAHEVGQHVEDDDDDVDVSQHQVRGGTGEHEIGQAGDDFDILDDRADALQDPDHQNERQPEGKK